MTLHITYVIFTFDMPYPLRKPPEALANIIRVVNLAPPEIELPEFAALLPNRAGEWLEKRLLDDRVWLKRKLQRAGLGEVFVSYVLGPEQSFYSEADAVRRYEFARTSQQSLRQIAQGRTSSLLTMRQINLNREGLIEVGSDDLSMALDGVEAARIRECEVCWRIFWAGRITQGACSAKCAKTLNVRRWRAKQGKTKEE